MNFNIYNSKSFFEKKLILLFEYFYKYKLIFMYNNRTNKKLFKGNLVLTRKFSGTPNLKRVPGGYNGDLQRDLDNISQENLMFQRQQQIQDWIQREQEAARDLDFALLAPHVQLYLLDRDHGLSLAENTPVHRRAVDLQVIRTRNALRRSNYTFDNYVLYAEEMRRRGLNSYIYRVTGLMWDPLSVDGYVYPRGVTDETLTQTWITINRVFGPGPRPRSGSGSGPIPGSSGGPAGGPTGGSPPSGGASNSRSLLLDFKINNKYLFKKDTLLEHLFFFINLIADKFFVIFKALFNLLKDFFI